MKCSSSKYPCSIVKAVANMAASPFALLRQSKAMNWIILQWERLFYTWNMNQQKTSTVNTGLQVINLILVPLSVLYYRSSGQLLYRKKYSQM